MKTEQQIIDELFCRVAAEELDRPRYKGTSVGTIFKRIDRRMAREMPGFEAMLERVAKQNSSRIA
jgi:hypothetical protein